MQIQEQEEIQDQGTQPLGDLVGERRIILASNRGPYTFHRDEEGGFQFQRGGGGLVTALTSLAHHVDAVWLACAMSEGDRSWQEEGRQDQLPEQRLKVRFILPDERSYHGYYHVIANPLLWFLQHSMWDMARGPTIDLSTWRAWDEGYVTVNRMFASEILRQMKEHRRPTLVMLQDYHLYLAPRMIREGLRWRDPKTTLQFFVHIPWPGTEDWGILPAKMRLAILDGLCAVDLVGFQTREDGLNFIRTCESHLPGARVNFKRGKIWYKNHTTYVRDFPISIDVSELNQLAGSEEVAHYLAQFQTRYQGKQVILRIDRTEPSKNIVRGFQAFDTLLDHYPEHRGQVQFLALFVPSRLEVEEYQTYLDELMAAAGRVNAQYGDSEWEPVRILVGENYPRAVAALILYDVLLVNSIADGMNLVAKEGPIVNQRNGVLILSERTGARQQLEQGALVISPCDIYDTASAIHQALMMPDQDRERMTTFLKNTIQEEDIEDWLKKQLKTIQALGL